MKLIKITAVAIAATMLATTGIALASAQFKQTAHVTLTATKAGASTGINAVIFSSDPGAPFGQPKALKVLTLALPPATKFNFKTKKIVQCKASDLEINLSASACPAKSKVGTGSAVANGAPVLPAISENVTAYAANNQIILVLVPTTPGASKIILHAKVNANKLTAEVPAITFGPVKIVLTELRLKVKAIGSGSASFVRTGKCVKKKFVVKSTFVYETGERLTLSSSSKCK